MIPSCWFQIAFMIFGNHSFRSAASLTDSTGISDDDDIPVGPNRSCTHVMGNPKSLSKRSTGKKTIVKPRPIPRHGAQFAVVVVVVLQVVVASSSVVLVVSRLSRIYFPQPKQQAKNPVKIATNMAARI